MVKNSSFEHFDGWRRETSLQFISGAIQGLTGQNDSAEVHLCDSDSGIPFNVTNLINVTIGEMIWGLEYGAADGVVYGV